MKGTASVVIRAASGALWWLLFLPLRLLVPRRRDWIAVLGRGDGRFVDNCKYFFIGAQANTSLRTVYVTSHKDVANALERIDAPAIPYPSIGGAWFLLRAGAAVVDTTEWTHHGRHALLAGARVVQLWHGVGFKRIELDRWRMEHPSTVAFWLRCTLYRLAGRLVRYEAVLTTSRFYARELFERAFLSSVWLSGNYPRNTFGRDIGGTKELTSIGTDVVTHARAEAWSRAGLKVIVVAPTFRDDGSDSLPMSPRERESIETFCQARGVRIVIKMHPLDRSRVTMDSAIAAIYDACCDVYPLLGIADALVTDYSSIYMDFLMTDRPILFHMPDLDRYSAYRDIQFELPDMTPGPRSVTWNEFLRHLDEQLNHDGFCEARAHLRAVAFDGHAPTDAVDVVLRHLLQLRGKST